MALSASEKMQVASSPRGTLVREMVTKYVNDGKLGGDAMEWDKTRGVDFRCVSHAIWIISSKASTFGDLSGLNRWLEAKDEVPASLRSTVSRALDTMVKILQHPTLSAPLKTKPSKIAPVEVIMILVLIAFRMSTYSLEELSQAIRKMRDSIRITHVDVRMNNKVGKGLMEFIANLPSGGKNSGRKRKNEDSEMPNIKPAKRKSTARAASPAASSSYRPQYSQRSGRH